MRAKTPLEVLADHTVKADTGCWLWTGCLSGDGYGKVNNRLGQTLAHRFSFVLHGGLIPVGTEIDHLCNVRHCVNPAHLQAVPHAVNVARADYTKNHRNGVKTHCIRGHAFTPENTALEHYGARTQRKCRTCRAARQRRAA